MPYSLEFFELYSGISSSTTTIITAPAANDKISGRRGWILFDRITPIIPPIGSNKPGIDANKKDFIVGIRSFLRGTDRENPSGKFCNTIDKDNVIAPAKLPGELCIELSEKAIPIEIPSTVLRSADERIIRVFFFMEEEIGELFLIIIYDINLSTSLKDNVPSKNPIVIKNRLLILLLYNLVAGISKDQIADDIIIPDMNPKNIL